MARDDGEVEFNDAEIQRILNSPEMQAEVLRVCNAIMMRARSISPVGKTSGYVNGFRVELKLRKQLRVVGYVINDSKHSAWIEARYGILTKSRRTR